MIKNFFRTGWRNFLKSGLHSFINVIGLSIGMSVALLIGLWIYNEFSFNKEFDNYNKIAQVMHHDNFNGEKTTLVWNPYLFGDLLLQNYGSDFKYIVMSTYPSKHPLKFGNKILSEEGNYMGKDVPYMLSLDMLKGSRDGLKDKYSILLSESVAKALFGNDNPLSKVIRIDNVADVKVTGVYRDLPYNSEFKSLSFIAPWSLLLVINPGIEADPDPWSNNNFLTYVQVTENLNIPQVSKQIENIKKNTLDATRAKLIDSKVFLHPMSKWHLYSEFKDGRNVGGQIEFVWLFGVIGIFVLLIACINCMNINIASSQKRAKEIGIRKSIGSERWQLFLQFYLESLFIVVFAFAISILLVQLILPFFNQVANKKISILWGNVWFWLCSIIFCLFTSIFAGAYSSIYLSSLNPVKVLKGVFRMGNSAIIQRKVLIGFQFTISIMLIMCTMIVLRQIYHGKNRPIGYNPKNLITINNTVNLENHFAAFRNELIKTGAAVDVVKSSNPTTENYVTVGNLEWQGKDPSLSLNIAVNNVTSQYGRVIGWKIIRGRDFSKSFPSDSSAFVINQAAVQLMGFKDPIGEIIKFNDKPYHVIGVIQNIIVESPYEQVKPYIYLMTGSQSFIITIKLNPTMGTRAELDKIEKVYSDFESELPFNFTFVDQEFAKKFDDLERVGTIATFFAVLTIFISCLGLFALTSLILEQRKKEIGIRKVLGAKIVELCGIFSKNFVLLVIISYLIAAPLSLYLMHQWLNNYSYRTTLEWWIIAVPGIVSIVIVMLVVNFQVVRAAKANPVKSLRVE